MTDSASEALREIQSQQKPKTSGLAIASLVCGIAAWTLLPILVTAVAAVVTGQMAKREIKSKQGALSGNGMATAGLILGWIQIALVSLALIAFMVILLTGNLGV
jgi:hypothetical protein